MHLKNVDLEQLPVDAKSKTQRKGCSSATKKLLGQAQEEGCSSFNRAAKREGLGITEGALDVKQKTIKIQSLQGMEQNAFGPESDSVGSD